MKRKFTPEDFWYIKLIDTDDKGLRKQPATTWGGYDTNFEENPDVYSYDETVVEDHDNWGIIGYRGSEDLLIVDSDAYKEDDLDRHKISVPSDHGPIVRSVSGGDHFYLLVSSTANIRSAQDWIDLKGEAAKGHAVSPFHSDDYDVVREREMWFYDHVSEINEAYDYAGDPLVTDERHWGAAPGGGFDILDEPPDEMPHCLKKALEARRQIPRDGTFSGNPWQIDSIVGRRLVALGYSKAEAMSLLEEYEPKDGFDARESSYQMDMLYRKELTPDSFSTLVSAGVFDDSDRCSCQVCEKITSDVEVASRIVDDWTGLEGHQMMQSPARTGKSHTLIGAAMEPHLDDQRKVYVGPTHNEARAAQEKFLYHDADSVVHLVGEELARDEYGISCDGRIDMHTWVSTPEEAARLPDEINGYRTLCRCAQEADIVCTVPELIHDVGDFDMLIVTEEAALKRMMASAPKIVEAKKVKDDRHIYNVVGKHKSRCQGVVDHIDDLEVVDYVNRTIREAALAIIDVCECIENWEPKNWADVEKEWGWVSDIIESKIDKVQPSERATFSQIRKRVDNFNRVKEILLSVIYSSGTHQYDNKMRKQLFLIGDVDRVFVDIDPDIVWTAGNSIPLMRKFHDHVHGNPPEPKGFMGGYTPVQDCMRIIKFTGRDNPNQQTATMNKIVDEVSYHAHEQSLLIPAGSSQYTSELANRHRKTTTMSDRDTLEDFKSYAEAGLNVSSPENSKFMEGVDSPWFDGSVMYNGRFATPVEDFIADEYGDDSLRQAELARAAQNAILRASNVPDGNGGVIGTGLTPSLVPSYHVPSGLFDMLEAFGFEVIEAENPVKARELFLEFLDPPTVTVHDGEIMPKSRVPDELMAFDELRSSDEAEDGSLD